jgi:predicted metal-binding membrane protein
VHCLDQAQLPLNFVNTHWSAPCEVMNLASNAEADSFGGADWAFAGGAAGVNYTTRHSEIMQNDLAQITE